MTRLPVRFALVLFLLAFVMPESGADASTVDRLNADQVVSSTTAANYQSAQGTATIDGLKGVSEWDAAAKIDFAVNQPPGSPGTPMPATLFLMNDATNLSIAFLISRPTLGSSSVDIAFDNDADGTLYANGDDVLLVNPAIGALRDEYSTNQPPCPAGSTCPGIHDTDDGGTTDGTASTTNNGTYSFYEMSHPLNSNDDNHDFSLSAGDLVGALASVRFCDTGGCSDTYVPGQFLIAVAPLPNGRANQRIVFPALASKTYGDPGFTATATATSRLAVSLAASGNCTVSNGSVVITGAGSCTLTASQPGDAFYNPASDLTQSFAIAKAPQQIDFPAVSKKRFGTPDFSASASASSGLTVRFAADGHCTVRGTAVHLTGVGTCTLTASQAGDSNYLAAQNVSRTFQIAPPPPCRVPNVIGKRLADARRAILRSHCSTGRVGSAYSAKKKGFVISQSRRAGRILPFRSKINVVVSRGRRR